MMNEWRSEECPECGGWFPVTNEGEYLTHRMAYPAGGFDECTEEN